MDALILDPLQEERVTVTGRVLNIPESLQTIGVKTDNKVERIYFELPRYFDGFNDFSEFNFYINYVNANGDGDVYYCDDLTVEDDNVVFSWLTKEKLYASKGTAQFTVRAYHSDGRKWNTTIAQLTILDGLETQEAVVEQDYDFINQQFEIIRKHTEKLNALIEQVKTNTTNLDKAINTMGKADWNGNQVRFTDGKGNYGQFHDISGEFISRDEIYLGYAMSQDYPYSGHAGNYGIDVAKIVGSYKQDGTPTPNNPVEPQFNVINNFNTNGGNLFDASKLPTKSDGRATVTNNGDGSFTISGSGNLTAEYMLYYEYTDVEFIRSLLHAGTIYVSIGLESGSISPYFGFLLRSNNNWTELNVANNKIIRKEITQEMLDADDLTLKIGFFAHNGSTILPATVKPVVYQDGDGTWYPFNASNTPVSLELRALPDGTADVWENGNTTTNVAKVTLDGSNNKYILQNYILPSSTTNNFGYYGISISGIIDVGRTTNTKSFLVNKLKKIISPSVAEEMSCYLYGTQLVVFTNQYTTKDDFNSYLQSNPIDVYYSLATPTTEPLAIPTLTSYYPFTNAWCDSELEPKLIEWHVNNKINYIEKLINEK